MWSNEPLPLDVSRGIILAAWPVDSTAEALDLRNTTSTDLVPPELLLSYLDEVSAAGRAIVEARRWSDGFVSKARRDGETLEGAMWMHRTGVIALSQEIVETSFEPVSLARVVDAMLAYLGWLYLRLQLQRLVALRLEIHGITELQTVGGSSTSPREVVEPGIEVSPLCLAYESMPGDFADAAMRHRLVQSAILTVVECFGLTRVDEPFTAGFIYGRGGVRTALDLQPSARLIWDHVELRQVGLIDSQGMVASSSTGRIVGRCTDGVIVDLDGHALGVVELAVGSGQPPDQLAQGPRAMSPLHKSFEFSKAGQGGSSTTSGVTRQWSARDLGRLLRDEETA
jgi:hypothetical protein